MDLNAIWKNIEKEKFKSPNINKAAIMKAISKESGSPLNELKKRLTYKMYWALGFCLAIPILMLIFVKNTEMFIVFSILETWYLIALAFIWYKVRQLNKVEIGLDMGNDLTKLINLFYKQTKQVLKFEEWMGTLFLPLAVICGMLLPLFYSGLEISEILGNTKILIVATVSIAIIVPLGIWAAKAMNEHAFQKYLDQLAYYKKRLEEL